MVGWAVSGSAKARDRCGREFKHRIAGGLQVLAGYFSLAPGLEFCLHYPKALPGGPSWGKAILHGYVFVRVSS